MSESERTEIMAALGRQSEIIEEMLRLMREVSRVVVNHADLERRVTALERKSEGGA